MVPSLSGSTALLTGGSQGSGSVIARALAAEGIHVALTARSAEPLEAIAREVLGAAAYSACTGQNGNPLAL